MLPMIRSLSEDLVIFTQGKPKISDAFRVRLQKDSIPIIEDRILPWRTRHAALQGAVLTNGQQIEVSALFVPPVQHSVRGVAPTGSGTVLELANETF